MRRLVSLVVLVTLAAACGGGSGGRLSHAQFVERANAVCKNFNAQLNALPPPTTTTKIGAYIKKAVPLEQQALVSLRKLEPPKSDESGYNLFLAQAQREATLAQTELVPATQAPSNPKHVQFVLKKLTAMDRQANALAEKIGLTTCAQSSTG